MNFTQAQSRHDAWLPHEPDDSAFQRRLYAIESNPDRSKVGELLFGDLPYVPPAPNAKDYDIEERDAAIQSMATVTAYAIEAWPIIERLVAGLTITAYQEALLPRFFRALKPWMGKAPILIRQAAEDGL